MYGSIQVMEVMSVLRSDIDIQTVSLIEAHMKSSIDFSVELADTLSFSFLNAGVKAKHTTQILPFLLP